MIIGLHGKKRAGKDTVFHRMTSMYGHKFSVARASFADLVYESAAAAVGVKVRDLHDWKSDPYVSVAVLDRRPVGDYVERTEFKVVKEITVREYLQRYGTEAHRELFGNDFWVQQVNLEPLADIIVVTDVRFDNEAQHIREEGGVVVHVVGPDEVEGADDAHASEAGIDETLIDFTLDNTVRESDFSALDWNIAEMMASFLMAERPA